MVSQTSPETLGNDANTVTRLKFIWLDILTMAAMGAVGLGVYNADPAPSRSFPIEFTGNEIVYPEFAYPLRTEIVPIWEAALLASLIPIAVILLMQIRIKSFWDVNNAILGLLYSLITAAVFQVFIKWLIGGLRPHFLYVCAPDLARVRQQGNLLGQGFGNIMFQRDICTGDRNQINDSLESMPSGHSTAAFAGFIYLYFYLNGKLKVFSNYHPAMWKLLATYAPVLGACLIAGSLTIDKYHNWYDCFAGAVIGTVMAISAYRMVYASVWDFRFNHIPLTRHTPFSYGAGEAGAGGFETAVFTRQAGWGYEEAYGGAPFDAAHHLRGQQAGFNNAIHMENGTNGVGRNEKGSGHGIGGLLHKNKGDGYNERGAGTTGTGLGHNDRGLGNNDTAAGYDQRGLGHHDRGLGHKERDAAVVGAGLGHNNHGLGHNNNTTTGIGHHNNATGLGRQSDIQGVGSNNQTLGHNESTLGHHNSNTTGLGHHNTTGIGSNNTTGLGHNTTTGLGHHNNTGLGSNTNTGLGQNTTTGFGHNNTAGLGHNETGAGYNQSSLGHHHNHNLTGLDHNQTYSQNQGGIGSGYDQGGVGSGIGNERNGRSRFTEQDSRAYNSGPGYDGMNRHHRDGDVEYNAANNMPGERMGGEGPNRYKVNSRSLERKALNRNSQGNVI